MDELLPSLLLLFVLLTGCVMWWALPHWAEHTKFPFRIFAVVLIGIQGEQCLAPSNPVHADSETSSAPLSFLADYVNMEKDSLFHVVDRFFAIFCLFMELWRVILLQQYANSTVGTLSAASILVAIFCFLNSRRSQQVADLSGFIFWHTLWHAW